MPQQHKQFVRHNFFNYLKSQATENKLTIPNTFSTKMSGLDFEIFDPTATINETEITINFTYNVLSGCFPISLLNITDIPSRWLENTTPEQDRNAEVIGGVIHAKLGATPSISVGFMPAGFDIMHNPHFSLNSVIAMITFTEKDTGLSTKLSVKGNIDITLYQKQVLNLNANANFVFGETGPTSADVGLVDTFTGGLKLPTILDNTITLDNIGFNVGVFFKPVEDVFFGFEASGKWKSPNYTTDIKKVAIVCTFDGDVPVPIYFGFSLDKLNIAQLIGAIAMELPLPNIPINFINPDFAYCSKATTLPDGTSVVPGLNASSKVDVFGCEFYGMVKYAKGESLSLDFQTDGPIKIGDVFEFSGTSKQIERTPNKFGHIPTTKEGYKRYKNASSSVFSKAGGASFSLKASKSDPMASEAHADGQVIFLGETIATCKASINSAGFSANISLDTPLITSSTTFACDLQNLTLGGSISFNPTKEIHFGAFGMLAPKYSISASLAVTETTFTGSISLDVNDTTITVPAEPVDLTGSTDISGIIEAIMMYIENNAIAISEKLITSPAIFMDLIKLGISVSPVGVPAKFLLVGLKALGVPTKELSKYIAEASQIVGYTADEVAAAFKSVYQETDMNKVASFLYSVGKEITGEINNFLPSDVAHALHKVFGAGVKDLATAFKYAGIAAKDTVSAIKSVFHDVAPGVLSGAMHAAGWTVHEIGTIFKIIGGAFEKFGKKLLNKLNPFHWF